MRASGAFSDDPMLYVRAVKLCCAAFSLSIVYVGFRYALRLYGLMGAILTGFGLGVIEGLTKVFYPEASNTVIFVIMVLVLLVKPAGLFGKER